MIVVTTNRIAEGIKVAGCGLVSWIFQDDKRENIELMIEQVIRIPGLPIRLIFPKQAARKTGHIGDGFYSEKDEVHLIFGGFKFTTKYNANIGLPIYKSVNGISKFKVYCH